MLHFEQQICVEITERVASCGFTSFRSIYHVTETTESETHLITTETGIHKDSSMVMTGVRTCQGYNDVITVLCTPIQIKCDRLLFITLEQVVFVMVSRFFLFNSI